MEVVYSMRLPIVNILSYLFLQIRITPVPKPHKRNAPSIPIAEARGVTGRFANPTYPGSPTQTSPAYRYRGPMKATPVAKLEGPGGPGTHKNRYGKLVASKKGRRSRRRSMFVKYQ